MRDRVWPRHRNASRTMVQAFAWGMSLATLTAILLTPGRADAWSPVQGVPPPELFYEFDDFTEDRGTGLDLTPARDVSFVSVPWGTALHGSDKGYVFHEDHGAFEPTSFTITACVRIAGPSDAGHWTIVSKGNTDADANGYWLAVYEPDNSRLRVSIGHGSGSTEVLGAPVPFGAWHRVAVTWDQAKRTAALYQEGQPTANDTLTHGIAYGPEHFMVMALTNRDDFGWNGEIDDLALWDKVLTPAQIAAVHSSLCRIVRPDDLESDSDVGEPGGADDTGSQPTELGGGDQGGTCPGSCNSGGGRAWPLGALAVLLGLSWRRRRAILQRVR